MGFLDFFQFTTHPILSFQKPQGDFYIELPIETLYDFIIENEDAGEDEMFDQFILVDMQGVYMIIHTFEKDRRLDQHLVAYDDLEEAKEHLRSKGIEFPAT